MQADVFEAVIVFGLFPTVPDDRAGLHCRHGERDRLFAGAAGANQVPLINRLSIELEHGLVGLDGPASHFQDGARRTISQIDGRSRFFALLVENLEPDVMIEYSL